MEELTERAVLRNLHKEQERERRRLRDRQRRQSMSVEEREKHLARRRRNYQLRRQRAQNPHLDPQLNKQTSFQEEGDGMLMPPGNEHQALISFPDKSNGLPPAAAATFDQRQESLNGGRRTSVGLEIPAHKLAKLPKRSRLSHIKRLARSLGDPEDTTESPRLAADLIARGTATSDCIPQIGLRLNRVKRLARTVNTDVTAVTNQNCGSEIEVKQDLPSDELLLTSRNSDQTEVVDSDNN
ncbi:hypothetical protein Tsubulata_020645 [Turnera subulata]|uniref:Uncharacterized protein n=1 Tax=Turnera subulata TaxID=218843 RepID=A0A9Q0JNT6_9ROSI|nr:hypothetical protein Tsubulata_020645 [Turnera subulata]